MSDLHGTVHHQRQARIIHPRMADATVIIAGLGMIGGWTALALARAVDMMYIIDPDTVEEVNIGCQPYNRSHIRLSKVSAMMQILHGFDVLPIAAHFPCPMGHSENYATPSIMVSAVDSMAGRRANAEWAQEQGIDLYLDGRIMGELAVLATALADVPDSYDAYLAALPSDDEVPDVPCGQSGTAYTGMWVASRIAAVINQFCKGIMPTPMEVHHVGAGVGLETPS